MAARITPSDLRFGKKRDRCTVSWGKERWIKRLGQTLLRWAAAEGHPSVAVGALAIGGEADAADGEGTTPLHQAAVRGDTETVSRLIGAGADIDAQMTDGFWMGRAPLHNAIYGHCVDVVEKLLEAGADPNQVDNKGQTPLHEAAREGEAKMAELLIEANASIDATDQNGQTPLHQAARRRSEAVAQHLLEAGADPTVADDCSWEAGERLAAVGSSEMRMKMAARPDAPEELIGMMVQAGSRPDLSGLSENDPAPLTAKERVRLREAGPYGRRLVAAHPGTSPSEVAELAWAVPGAVLQNPALPLFAVEQPGWKEEITANAWEVLLRRPEVPKAWLREGARRGKAAVRRTVAENQKTPPDVLAELMTDASYMVRRTAAQNPTTPLRKPMRWLRALSGL